MSSASTIYRRTAVLNLVITGHTGGLPGFNRIQADLERFANRPVLRTTALLSNLGMVGGLAVGGIGVEALKAAGNFQQMTQAVAGNTNMTMQQLNSMRTGVKNISAQTGADMTQVAGGYMRAINEGFSQAGKSWKTQAEEIVKAATKSAISAGANVEDVTNALAISMHDFGYHGRQAINVMNALHTAAAEGNMRLEDMAKNFAQVAAMAHGTGVSFADAATAMAVLTRTGMSASRAQTQISGLFFQMLNPSPAAKQQLYNLAQETGINVVKAFSAGGLKEYGLGGVTDIIDKALRKWGAMHGEKGLPVDKLSQIVTQRRGVYGMLELLNSLQNAQTPEGAHISYQQIFRDVSQAGGMNAYGAISGPMIDPETHRKGSVTDRLFNAMMGTQAGQMARFHQRFLRMMIDMGGAIQRPFVSMIKTITGGVDTLDHFINQHKELVSTFFKWGVAIGAAGASMRLLIGAYVHARTIFVASPWIALGVAMIYLYNNSKMFHNMVQMIAGTLTGVTKAIDGFLSGHETTKKVFATLLIGGLSLMAVVRVVNAIRNAFMGVTRAATGAAAAMRGASRTTPSGMMGGPMALGGPGPGFGRRAWGGVRGAGAGAAWVYNSWVDAGRQQAHDGGSFRGSRTSSTINFPENWVQNFSVRSRTNPIHVVIAGWGKNPPSSWFSPGPSGGGRKRGRKPSTPPGMDTVDTEWWPANARSAMGLPGPTVRRRRRSTRPGDWRAMYSDGDILSPDGNVISPDRLMLPGPTSERVIPIQFASGTREARRRRQRIITGRFASFGVSPIPEQISPVVIAEEEENERKRRVKIPKRQFTPQQLEEYNRALLQHGIQPARKFGYMPKMGGLFGEAVSGPLAYTSPDYLQSAIAAHQLPVGTDRTDPGVWADSFRQLYHLSLERYGPTPLVTSTGHYIDMFSPGRTGEMGPSHFLPAPQISDFELALGLGRKGNTIPSVVNALPHLMRPALGTWGIEYYAQNKEHERHGSKALRTALGLKEGADIGMAPYSILPEHKDWRATVAAMAQQKGWSIEQLLPIEAQSRVWARATGLDENWHNQAAFKLAGLNRGNRRRAIEIDTSLDQKALDPTNALYGKINPKATKSVKAAQRFFAVTEETIKGITNSVDGFTSTLSPENEARLEQFQTMFGQYITTDEKALKSMQGDIDSLARTVLAMSENGTTVRYFIQTMEQIQREFVANETQARMLNSQTPGVRAAVSTATEYERRIREKGGSVDAALNEEELTSLQQARNVIVTELMEIEKTLKAEIEAKFLPLQKAGQQVGEHFLQGMLGGKDEWKKVSAELGSRNVLGYGWWPGSPTPSGTNFTTIGQKVASLFAGGLGGPSSIDAVRAASNRLGETIIGNKTAAMAAGERNAAAYVEGEQLYLNEHRAVAPPVEGMTTGGFVGGGMGGKWGNRLMMAGMVAPMAMQFLPQSAQDNPLVQQGFNVMSMAGMMSMFGMGLPKMGKIPGVGKFFKAAPETEGGASIFSKLGSIFGMGGGGAAITGGGGGAAIAGGGEVAGLEGAGVAADATGVGLPVGIALALAGAGVALYKFNTGFRHIINGIVGFAKNNFSTIATVITAPFALIPTMLAKFALDRGFRGWLGKGLDVLSNGVASVKDGIGGFFGQIGNWVKTDIGDPSRWAINLLTSFDQGLTNSSITQKIKGSIKGVADTIKGWIGWHSPTELGGRAYDSQIWGQNVIGSLAAGITSKKTDVGKAAKGVADTLKNSDQWKSSGHAAGKSWTTNFIDAVKSGSLWGDLGHWLDQHISIGTPSFGGNQSNQGNANYTGTGGAWQLNTTNVPFGVRGFTGPSIPGANRDVAGDFAGATAWWHSKIGGTGPYSDTDFMSTTGKPTNIVLPGSKNLQWQYLGDFKDPSGKGGIGERWLDPQGHQMVFWHTGQQGTNPNANPRGRDFYNPQTHQWQPLVAGQTYHGGQTVGQSGTPVGEPNHLCIVTSAEGRQDLVWLTTTQMMSMSKSAKVQLASNFSVPAGQVRPGGQYGITPQQADLFNTYGKKYGLPPALLAGIAQGESGMGKGKFLMGYAPWNKSASNTNWQNQVSGAAYTISHWIKTHPGGNLADYLNKTYSGSSRGNQYASYIQGIAGHIATTGSGVVNVDKAQTYHIVRTSTGRYHTVITHEKNDFGAGVANVHVGGAYPSSATQTRYAHGSTLMESILWNAHHYNIDPRLFLMAGQFASGLGMDKTRMAQRGWFGTGTKFNNEPLSAVGDFGEKFSAAFRKFHGNVQEALRYVTGMTDAEFNRYEAWIGQRAYRTKKVRQQIYQNRVVPVGTSSSRQRGDGSGHGGGDNGPGGNGSGSNASDGFMSWSQMPKTPASFYNQNPFTNPKFGTNKTDPQTALQLFQEWQSRFANLQSQGFIKPGTQGFNFNAWQTAVAHQEYLATNLNKWFATVGHTTENVAFYHRHMETIREGIQTYFQKLVKQATDAIENQKVKDAQAAVNWSKWFTSWFKGINAPQAVGMQDTTQKKFWQDPLVKQFQRAQWQQAIGQYNLEIAQVNKWWSSAPKTSANSRLYKIIMDSMGERRGQLYGQAAANAQNLYYEGRISRRALQERLLVAQTKAPGFSTYTAAQRNVWLEREIKLLRLQEKDANDKATEAYNTTIDEARAGAFGDPKGKYAQEQIRVAKEQLKVTKQTNAETRAAREQAARQKATGASGQGRVVPVRVTGSCPDGTLPTTTNSTSARKNRANTKRPPVHPPHEGVEATKGAVAVVYHHHGGGGGGGGRAAADTIHHPAHPATRTAVATEHIADHHKQSLSHQRVIADNTKGIWDEVKAMKEALEKAMKQPATQPHHPLGHLGTHDDPRHYGDSESVVHGSKVILA